MEYRLLLLDFGGVCLLNPVELHLHTEQKLGLAPGTLDWLGPIDPSTDELWQRMVDGELTERDYWAIRAAEVGELAGRNLDVREYMGLVYEPARPELVRPACTNVVKRARRAGTAVSVLTNDMRAFHGRDWEHGIDFFDLVDHIVDCSDFGVLKPDPRAYGEALTTCGFGAPEALFIDDQPINIEGANAVGIDALWFDVANAEQSWAEVAERLDLGP